VTGALVVAGLFGVALVLDIVILVRWLRGPWPPERTQP
jgi:hypothetical protein